MISRHFYFHNWIAVRLVGSMQLRVPMAGWEHEHPYIAELIASEKHIIWA